MNKLRMAVIGAGFIGGIHARIITGNPMAELVGIVNPSAPKGQALSEVCGCRYYPNMDELFENEQVDAVAICAPDEWHEPLSVAAAKAKKHILLEKPIARTAEEGRRIKDAVRENNVRLMVAHVLKFDPRYTQLRDAVRGGKLGEITSIFMRRNNSRSQPRMHKGKTSIFYHLGVHELEWMLDYMDSKPVRVYAQASCKVNKEIELPDTVYSVINFENGAIGCMELCWALPANKTIFVKSSVKLVGTLGAGFIEGVDQGLSLVTDDELSYPDIIHWPQVNGKICGDMSEEINHFIMATLTGTPYAVDTDRAIEAVRVAEACMESLETNMPVLLTAEG